MEESKLAHVAARAGSVAPNSYERPGGARARAGGTRPRPEQLSLREWLRVLTTRRVETGRANRERIEHISAALEGLRARVDGLETLREPQQGNSGELAELRRNVAANFAVVEEQLRAEAERDLRAGEAANEELTRITPLLYDLAGKFELVHSHSLTLEERARGEIDELRQLMQTNFALVQGRLQEESVRNVQARRQTSDQLAHLSPLLQGIAEKIDTVVLHAAELEERLGEELEQTRLSMRNHFALAEQRLQAEAARNVRANQTLSDEVARLGPIVASIGERIEGVVDPTPELNEKVRSELAELRGRISHSLAEIRQQLNQELDDLRTRAKSNFVYLEERMREEQERNLLALRLLNERVEALTGMLSTNVGSEAES